MKFLRQIRRKRMREILEEAYDDGCRIAHIPAFPYHAPRRDQHRAIESAFMRGFVAQQAEIQKPSPLPIRSFGFPTDQPNNERGF